MKTTNQMEASAPANARPSSVAKSHAFNRHCQNRKMTTEAALNYLRTRLPRQYELAEVVGKWVWLDVSPARKPNLAALLWAMGFHWNRRRGVWQQSALADWPGMSVGRLGEKSPRIASLRTFKPALFRDPASIFRRPGRAPCWPETAES